MAKMLVWINFFSFITNSFVTYYYYLFPNLSTRLSVIIHLIYQSSWLFNFACYLLLFIYPCLHQHLLLYTHIHLYYNTYLHYYTLALLIIFSICNFCRKSLLFFHSPIFSSLNLIQIYSILILTTISTHRTYLPWKLILIKSLIKV